MQPEPEFPGNYLELLTSWLHGTHIATIRRDFSTNVFSPEQLARLIENFFGYKLPWGISSFLRIAQQNLTIESSDLSLFSAFFPSMVKFGVPFPAAAWAMSAGIPFRDIGISIGTRYVRESATPAYEDFLTWLSRIESEELRESYGLRTPLLEDVSRALGRAARNPLLEQTRNVEDLLPLEVEVRGIRHGDRRTAAARLGQGAEVTLRRDYGNFFDHNAILVEFERQEVGYLPRDAAQVFAPEMDSGLPIQATVVELLPEPVPKITIELSLRASG